MKKLYREMDAEEKAFFDAPMDTVCPLGSKFNKIYFYKFLDQYTCLQGGPGQLRKKAAKSANLLKRFSGAGNTYRIEGGLKGSVQTPELLAALKTLGLKAYSHAGVQQYPINFAEEANEKFKNQNDHFVVCHTDNIINSYPVFNAPPKVVDKEWTEKPYPRTIKIESRLFDIASASIGIFNKDYKGLHAGHFICAYVDFYGKGYLFDSNQMSNYVRCDWWDPKKLEKTIRGPFISGHYDQFKGDNITKLVYNNFVYVRRTFVSKNPVTCRLKTRRLNFNTRAYMHYKNMNELQNALTRQVTRGEISQAERIKIIKNFILHKFNTSKYMKYNNKNSLTQSLNRNTNLTKEQRNKIIKNYEKLERFNVRNYMNTPNGILNDLVRTGVMKASEREKIARAKKLVITFEMVKEMPITKNTIKNYEEAGYILSDATKRKIRKFLGEANLTPSPNPNRTGFTPSPPRKKRPVVINLRTPTPVRSNPRTPTPVRSNPRTPTPVRSNPRTPTPARSNLNLAKSAVKKLKTINARKAYLRTQALNMSNNNRRELSNYISRLNAQKRAELKNKRTARAPPSPGAGWNMTKIKNALTKFKTMKERRNYIMKKKTEGILTPNNLANLRKLADELNNKQRELKKKAKD
jgi:hypothetical protein